MTSNICTLAYAVVITGVYLQILRSALHPKHVDAEDEYEEVDNEHLGLHAITKYKNAVVL